MGDFLVLFTTNRQVAYDKIFILPSCSIDNKLRKEG